MEYKTFSLDDIKETRYAKYRDFRNLMQFKINNILLVSSLYDSFIFEEDGRLYELIREEYHGMNLSNAPEIIHFTSGKEALRNLNSKRKYDLVIITQHIEDMTPLKLVEKIKKEYENLPVVHVGYENNQLVELMNDPRSILFEQVFVWQGDFRLLIGIIKYIEDKVNVENDTRSIGVQVIILIEDNVRFYSSYLPIIYSEVLSQTRNLIESGVNITHKYLRNRARPKILLYTSYEEAWNAFRKHQKYVLGIISDINFKRKGIEDPKAGIRFAKRVKAKLPDIPVLLQSDDEKKRDIAYSIEAGFILKSSPTLHKELQKFMRKNFGFDDFIFRDENGQEVGRVKNLFELEEQLRKVPIESILFHSRRNHFSVWLKARTEFQLAEMLRPKQIEDFASPEVMREHLTNSIREFILYRHEGVIVDFHKESFGDQNTIARIGSGSLGGKARGIAFVNYLLTNLEVKNRFENVSVTVPPTVIIGTDVFDDFLDANNLRQFALETENDRTLKKKFIAAQNFPMNIGAQLYSFLDIVTDPIAVRSSSLMEDSQGQPFAGVYETVMLPNNSDDTNTRFNQLLDAIKLVYASMFYKSSKDYMKITSHRLEEEKMAIIIQKIVGSEYSNRFYPELSGVAKSINFYPTTPFTTQDGIISIALGMGKTIVSGENAVRFCAKYPQKPMHLLTTEDYLEFTQKDFYAMDLSLPQSTKMRTGDSYLKKYDLKVAEKDGALFYSGSTYSLDNNTIYDGLSRKGPRLVTFAPILKHKVFPLPEISQFILEMGKWGMGSEIEIEFAANLNVPKGKPKELNILQMRPLVVQDNNLNMDIGKHKREELICKSEYALGNGLIQGLTDIVYVDIDKFNRSESSKVAEELTKINSELRKANKQYLLIGVGRWGSTDPWLGIPVSWDQISNAGAIVESNFKDFDVTPSQGSHFFQNLTSFRIGYFTVNTKKRKGFIDWKWLRKQNATKQFEYSSHITLDEAIVIKINGQKNIGVIVKRDERFSIT